MQQCDYLILGGGLAGLIAALKASGHGTVLVITKQGLLDSNSRYAQGGIAAALDEADSPALHASDTLLAGAGLCDPAAVEVLTEEGTEAVRELIAAGVPFDLHNGEVSLGREGAHSLPRIVHAGGDATGARVVATLARLLEHQPNVTIREWCMLTDLHKAHGTINGAWLFDVRAADARQVLLQTRHVILATGGAGQLYSHTTNPAIATGDGVAAAYRAGAAIADAEFFQFHPTALSLEGAPSFLISEAVRGEGGKLYAHDGARFMPSVHSLAELAPRDVVARAIASEMARCGGKPVLLDMRHMSASAFAGRFPTIDATCRRYGIDPVRDRIPVAPAAHYWMGGVWTDLWGRTSLPGLFACGEVACTGVHGANRLASNSLLEALVFGKRAVEASLVPWDGDFIVPSEYRRRALTLAAAPNHGERMPDRQIVQRRMWQFAGLDRDQAGLSALAAELAQWSAVDASTPEAIETRNLIHNGWLVSTFALERHESRGAHWRRDFPETDPSWQKRLVLRQGPLFGAELVTVAPQAVPRTVTGVSS